MIYLFLQEGSNLLLSFGLKQTNGMLILISNRVYYRFKLKCRTLHKIPVV
jgi:hypothetical protein